MTVLVLWLLCVCSALSISSEKSQASLDIHLTTGNKGHCEDCTALVQTIKTYSNDQTLTDIQVRDHLVEYLDNSCPSFWRREVECNELTEFLKDDPASTHIIRSSANEFTCSTLELFFKHAGTGIETPDNCDLLATKARATVTSPEMCEKCNTLLTNLQTLAGSDLSKDAFREQVEHHLSPCPPFWNDAGCRGIVDYLDKSDATTVDTFRASLREYTCTPEDFAAISLITGADLYAKPCAD